MEAAGEESPTVGAEYEPLSVDVNLSNTQLNEVD